MNYTIKLPLFKSLFIFILQIAFYNYCVTKEIYNQGNISIISFNMSAPLAVVVFGRVFPKCRFLGQDLWNLSKSKWNKICRNGVCFKKHIYLFCHKVILYNLT